MVGGFGGGGFLNLGTPEVIVIGAVAWVILGPKELFRLSKQAGEFIGQWQQLGQQAKDTFTSALEAELKEDEAAAAAEAAGMPPVSWDETPPASPVGGAASVAAMSTEEQGPSPPTMGSSPESVPSLAEMAAARAAEAGEGGAPTFTAEEEAALRESLYEDLGEPVASAANFQEQISGARNAQVMAEYPAELSAPQDGSAEDVQSSEEMLLATQIAETENQLELLKTEKTVLALKRKQLEANAERARRMAAERALELREDEAEAAVEEAQEEGAATTEEKKA